VPIFTGGAGGLDGVGAGGGLLGWRTAEGAAPGMGAPADEGGLAGILAAVGPPMGIGTPLGSTLRGEGGLPPTGMPEGGVGAAVGAGALVASRGSSLPHPRQNL
jgi:hypothetical protein